jgi:formylglycine-generating enzyme required for sulfatase activity
MKYEISQGQYIDFLNTLTRTQQGTRVASDISGTNVTNNFVMTNGSSSSFRNTIQCPTTGNGTSPTRVVFNTGSRDSRAASYLSWMDLMAYADWAGLRPITELEFEKAARGPNTPVTGEYAWGTTNITQCLALTGTGDSEVCTTTNANGNFTYTTFTGGDAGFGPLRVGIFSTASTTTREGAGAGYYGNMDLSGSVYERTVTVGNAAGRAFIGTHGDGVLTSAGNATNTDWPGIDATPANGITGGAGAGSRGGHWNLASYLFYFATTSARVNATDSLTTRSFICGGRVGRTAPQ